MLGDPCKVLRGQGASMVAEDFSFFGRAGVPATLALLGTRNESAGAVGAAPGCCHACERSASCLHACRDCGHEGGA